MMFGAICLALFVLETVSDFNRNPWVFLAWEWVIKNVELHKDWKNAIKLCLKSAEVEQSGFCHEKMKVTKGLSYYTGSQISVACNQSVRGSKGSFVLRLIKSLDSGLRAEDALSNNVSGVLFSLSPKQKRILANNLYNLRPVINPVTIQRRLNWTKLMNKESACMLSEKPETSDKHFRLFLEKWKTNCNQLFGDSISTFFFFFFLPDEICWTQHSYNS